MSGRYVLVTRVFERSGQLGVSLTGTAQAVRGARRHVHRQVAQLRSVRSSFSGWPGGHRAALSLSFDDARPSQIEHGLPLLERLGVPATFFVLPHAVGEQLDSWREVVAHGHEIGNHTTSHPCSCNHAWSRGNALEQMTLSDYRWDVFEAGRTLRRLLGVTPEVFAYPCGRSTVGRAQRTRSVVPFIAQNFTAGRTYRDWSANWPLAFDTAQVACVSCDDDSQPKLMPLLEASLADASWLVLGGHDIGEDPGFEITSCGTIEAIVDWCRTNDVWIDTIGNVATAVRAARS